MTMSPPYPSYPGSKESGASTSDVAQQPIPPDSLTELNASRAKLRSALMDIAYPPKPHSLMANGLTGLGQQLLDRARAIPGASAVEDGARAWWHQSPARKVATLAGPTAVPLLSSVARKNPQALLLTSAAVGALVMILPKRRILFRLFRPALLFGLVSEVVKATKRR